MVVEEGPIDVAGEEARPRQALGRRTGTGFDVEAPSGGGDAIQARQPGARTAPRRRAGLRISAA